MLDDEPVCRQDSKNRLCPYLSMVYKLSRTIDNTRLIYKFQSAFFFFLALSCSADIAGQGKSRQLRSWSRP